MSANPWTIASKQAKAVKPGQAKRKAPSLASPSKSKSKEEKSPRHRGSDDDVEVVEPSAVKKARTGSVAKSSSSTSTSKSTAKSAPKPTSKSSAKTTSKAASSSSANVNRDLTDILTQLGNSEKASGNVYKSRAYFKAVASLSRHPTRITSGKEAEKLEGIGKKIGKKIDEILETGTLNRLEEDKKNVKLQAVSLFNRIAGIGPVKAASLLNEHGITSLEELRARPDLLNPYQKIGLQFFEDFEKRIPRAEIEAMEKYMRYVAERCEQKYGCAPISLTVCGSYRRGAESSGDIDVLVTSEEWVKEGSPKPSSLDRFVSMLKSEGFITHELGSGAKKYTGVCRLQSKHIAVLEGLETKDEEESGDNEQASTSRLSSLSAIGVGLPDSPHRRIDLRFFPTDCYHCGTLYFTGPDILNKDMRVKAIELNLILNEYSLTKVDKDTKTKGASVPIHSERDVFEALGMDYLTPEERAGYSANMM